MTNAIKPRVKRFMHRQIAWVENVLRDLAAEAPTTDAGELDARVARQARDLRVLESLTQECEALLREWTASDPDPADRAEVRALAEQAGTVIVELQTRYAEVARATSEQLAETRKALGELRRNKTAIKGYRPGGTGNGCLDNKA